MTPLNVGTAAREPHTRASSAARRLAGTEVAT